MVSFGLVTEGITDQIVIEYILAGYFNNPNILVNPLQPERDKDNENKSGYGGWTLVFQYCKSVDFQQAFQFNDYIIIQIDTDVSEEYGVPKQDENGELTPDRLIAEVIKQFRVAIGEDFYTQTEHRIIFAIAVHSVECWLLPLYYTDNRKSKIQNCLDTLNRELGKKVNFTIGAKNPQYYRKIAEQYSTNKKLLKSYKNNPSLKIFIEEMEKRKIVIEEEEF